MSVSIPTLNEIVQKIGINIVNNVNAGVLDTDKYINLFTHNYFSTLAESLGGGLYDMYLTSQSIFNNLWLTTQNDEKALETAGYFGINRRAATKSSGIVVFTGTNGGSVPVSTLLIRADNVSYITTTLATISTQNITVSGITRLGTVATCTIPTNDNLATGMQVTISGANETQYNGTFEITVVSETQFTYEVIGSPATPATGTINLQATYGFANVEASDFGIDSNLDGGGIISLDSPIVDVDDNVIVNYNGLTGGQDIETVDNIRIRTRERTSSLTTAYTNPSLKVFVKNVLSTATRAWVFSANAFNKTVVISNLVSDSNGIAILTPASPISFLDGTQIYITGANENQFNIKAIGIKNANDDIVYNLKTTYNGTGTGNITMQYSNIPAGYTKIYFTKDNFSNIIPNLTDLSIVKNAIIGNTQGIDKILPANTPESFCQVIAPIPVSVDIGFSSLTPSTDDMKNAITLSLENFFKSNTVNVAENVSLNVIKGIIANTVDSIGNIPSFVLSSPLSDITIDEDQLAVLGIITF